MKVIKDGVEHNITDQVKFYENELLTTNIVTVCSVDHIDHIAAFVAWKKVGGKIFVKAPFLTQEQSSYLDKKILDIQYNNAIFFHTSGTTGVPKVAVHQQEQMNQALIMSTNALEWTRDDTYLNFLPAFTVGFWHMVLTALVHHNFTIVIGSRETVLQDLASDCNITILVPALIDQIRIKNEPVDFSKFRRVGTGSSAVLDRHVNYLFSNGCRVLNHMYGTTEVCAPILKRTTTDINDNPRYLDLTPLSDASFKIVDNVLWIKGRSLCSNIEDFDTVDGWFNTNDRWIQEGNLIKFDGRTNDIVKVNGFQTSLLAIETIAEDNINLGESIAVVRNSMGTDWVELFFTNKDQAIDRNELIKRFSKHLPSHSVPRKFTWVSEVPRNGMGKKVRS